MLIQVVVAMLACSRCQLVRLRLRRDVGRPRPGTERGGCGRACRRDRAGVRQSHRSGWRARQGHRGGAANRVWGQAPDVTNADVTFPPCPPGAPGVPDTCVRVDVFRNQRAGGNPLPMFFGRLVGVMDQGVRATATAQIHRGYDGLPKPWAVIDRWDEYGTRPTAPSPVPDPDSFLVDVRPVLRRSGAKPAPGKRPLHRHSGTRRSPAPVSGCQTTRDAVRDQVGLEQQRHGVSGWFRAIRLPRARRPERRQRLPGQHHVLRWPAFQLRQPGTVVPDGHRQRRPRLLGRPRMFRRGARQQGRADQQAIEDSLARDQRRVLAADGGIVGSTFSPPTSSPRVVPIGRHRYRLISCRRTRAVPTACAPGQHLRLLHRRHGRCESRRPAP